MLRDFDSPQCTPWASLNSTAKRIVVNQSEALLNL